MTMIRNEDKSWNVGGDGNETVSGALAETADVRVNVVVTGEVEFGPGNASETFFYHSMPWYMLRQYFIKYIIFIIS